MDPQALLAEIPMYPACKRMFLLQKKIQKKEKENTILNFKKKACERIWSIHNAGTLYWYPEYPSSSQPCLELPLKASLGKNNSEHKGSQYRAHITTACI